MLKQIAMMLVSTSVALLVMAEWDNSVVAQQVADSTESVAKNSVGSEQIIDGAVKRRDLRNRSINAKKLFNWWETGPLMANATVNPEIRNWNGKRLKGQYYLKSFCVLTRSSFGGDDHAASIQMVMVAADGYSTVEDVAMLGLIDFHPKLYFDSTDNGVLRLKAPASIGLHEFNCRFEEFRISS